MGIVKFFQLFVCLKIFHNKMLNGKQTNCYDTQLSPVHPLNSIFKAENSLIARGGPGGQTLRFRPQCQSVLHMQNVLNKCRDEGAGPQDTAHLAGIPGDQGWLRGSELAHRGPKPQVCCSLGHWLLPSHKSSVCQSALCYG